MNKKIITFLFLIILGKSVAQNSFDLTKKVAVKNARFAGVYYDTCYSSGKIENVKNLLANERFQLLRNSVTNGLRTREEMNGLATAEIVVNFGPGFDNFPEAAQAFQFAADIWSTEVISSVPIVIDAEFNPLGDGVIGSNSSNTVINVPNAPDPSTQYVASLGNAIAGVDLLPNAPDMTITFNSDFNFFFGLEGDGPINEFDFVTIVLHEIGHGMGISGVSSGGGGVGANGGSNPRSWDLFIELGDGTPILSLGFGTPTQVNALIGGDLFFNGFNAVQALGGNRPEIFAPNPFNGGSSFSHWDETVFPAGDPNSLMTPFAGQGETNFNIGDITRGALRDQGWILPGSTGTDIAINSLLSPVSSTNLTSAEVIQIEVANFGLEAASNFPLSFVLNDNDTITEIFTEVIQPASIETFTFNTTIDLSLDNMKNELVIFVDLIIDGNPNNDVLLTEINNLPSISGFPYNESFENGTGGWTVQGTPLFELGEPNNLIINSASDGQNAWVTGLESNYTNDAISYVISPSFDFSPFSEDPFLTVDINYDIETGWDGAALQSSIDNGNNWVTIGEFGDPQNWYTDGLANTGLNPTLFGNDGIDALEDISNSEGWTGAGESNSGGYLTAGHALDGLAGENNVLLRFIFASDEAINNEGFAFDNINITGDFTFDVDLAIISIESPSSGVLGSEIPEITLANIGLQTVSGFQLDIVVNDEVISETFNQTLLVGDTITVSFSEAIEFTELGQFNVQATVFLDADENLANNNLAVNVNNLGAVISNFPYIDSFESVESFWFTSGINSSWELGAPNGVTIVDASNGSNAWATNLSGNYNSNELSVLISPEFNLTGVSSPTISFDLFFDLETGIDGLVFQYSLDRGNNWQNVGSLGEPANWFNSTDLETSNFGSDNGEGWSENSQNYIKAYQDISLLAGENSVVFRLAFASNSSNQLEGIYFDQFSLFDSSDLTFSVICQDNIITPTSPGESFVTLSIDDPQVNGEDINQIVISNDLNNQQSITNEIFSFGSSTIIYLADFGGLVDICDVDVLVQDLEPPIISCPEEVVVAVESGVTSGTIIYPFPSVDDNAGIPPLISHLVSTFPSGFNSISCPTGPNNYFREFNLQEDFGINDIFTITSIDIGIQAALAGSGSLQSATLNIYTFDEEVFDINSADLNFSNLNLIASTEFEVANGGLFVVNVPITATIPAGLTMVAEVVSSGGPNGTTDALFLGTNTNVIEGASFILAPQCGVTTIANVNNVGQGFPLAQWTISIPQPSLVSGLGSGSVLEVNNNSEESYLVEDSSGNTNTCSFDANIVQSNIVAPNALNGEPLTPSSFRANWTNVLGADNYELDISTDENFTSIQLSLFNLSTSDTTLVISGLEPNLEYYYRVRVRNNSNDMISIYSNIIKTGTTLEAPNAFEAINLLDTSFTANWSIVGDVSNYELDFSIDNFANIQTIDVDGSSLNIIGLQPSSEFQYRVRATNDFSTSPNSNVVSVITLPLRPNATEGTNLSNSNFTLNFDPVPGIFNYEIDISTNNFQTSLSEFDSIVISSTSLEVGGLLSNTNYSYRVRSIDNEGRLSPNSNVIRVTTLPSAPIALGPIDLASFAFKAAWESNDGATNFEIQFSQDNFESFLSGFESIILSTTSFLIEGLIPETSYQYRVRSIGAGGLQSSFSNVINVTTLSNSGLEAPIATEATENRGVSFVANWQQSEGALFYQLDVSDDQFANLVSSLQGTNIFVTSREVTDFIPGQIQYRVRAFDNQGFSDFSNIIDINTILSINDLEFLEGVELFPNPAFDVTNVGISNELTGEFEISIHDYLGNKIQSVFISKSGESVNQELDISNLSEGLYLIRIVNGNFARALRIIKQ